MSPEEYKKQLIHEMKVTKGCRFNAAERMRQRDRRNATTNAFASIYVICLTLIPLYFQVPVIFVNTIGIATIVLSLIILTFSLLQYSNNDSALAEQHHRCGLEISALRRELCAMVSVDEANMKEYARKYNEVLQKYGTNHEPIDFERYKAEHPDEYINQPLDEQEIRDVRREKKGGYAERVTSIMSILVGIISALAVGLSSDLIGYLRSIVVNLFERFSSGG